MTVTNVDLSVRGGMLMISLRSRRCFDQGQHLAQVIVVPGPDERPGGIEDGPGLLRKADQIASQTICQQ